MTDWTSLDYAVVDVEGNGQQPPDLVELAVVPIRSGVIAEPVSWLVRPGEPIRHFATRIHGLTNEDVAGAPLFTDIADQVLAALDMPALVAHNAHVDVDVLTRKLAGWQPPEVFDTLRIARRLLPGRAGYRLGALTSAFHLADGGPAVRQAGDPRGHARRTARQPAGKGGRRCSAPFLTVPAACSSPWTGQAAPGSQPSWNT